MISVLDGVAGIALVFGALIGLLAAVGLLRMPDFYSRLQASTKAQTLGLVAIMLGTALAFRTGAVTAKSLLVIVFVFLTAPVAGHLIARAAYLLKVPLWDQTCRDELEGKIDWPTRTVHSTPRIPPSEEGRTLP